MTTHTLFLSTKSSVNPPRINIQNKQITWQINWSDIFDSGTRGKCLVHVVLKSRNKIIPAGIVLNPNTNEPVLLDLTNLTSTWVAYGDSFTQNDGNAWGPTWAVDLANASGTTLINMGANGRTSDWATTQPSQTNPPVKTSAYQNYSSLVMYGFNDVRNNKSLYATENIAGAWKDNIFSLALSLSLPQNKIDDCQTGWTASSAGWGTHPAFSFGRMTNQVNTYIEKNLGTCRYIACRFTILQATLATQWELQVNGVVKKTYNIPQLYAESTSYHTQAFVVDLGSNTPNSVVRLTLKSDDSQNSYVDFISGWASVPSNETLTDSRDVLFMSIPEFDYQYSGGAPWNAGSEPRRVAMNSAIQSVATTLRSYGLPVRFFQLSPITASGTYSDHIHPTASQSLTWANEIFANGVV